MLALTALLASALLTLTQATLQVIPGATWTASNGHALQAHGGGITKVGSTFYFIGEDKTLGSSFQNINCYSSSNLVEWKFERALLTLQSSGDLGPNRVVERPKVVFNRNTNQYVMYMHIDDASYGEAKVGVATSGSVCGEAYTYRGSFQPLGWQSRDMGLYVDEDGKGYLLTEDRQNGLRINALSTDYLSVTSNVYTWAEKYEAPAILKRGNTYFMFASKLSGWNPNDNIYSTATSLSGPWTSWKTFAPVGSNTFASQTTFILPLSSTTAIYMGDRWIAPPNLNRSTYVWLPLTISGTTVTLSNTVNWVPNVSAGTASAGPSETTYEGESAALSAGARSVDCSGCSGGAAAGYIGGSSNGEAYFASVSSQAATRTSVRIKYTNGDSSERVSNVSVNGVSVGRVAFLPTGGAVGSGVVHVGLRQGSNDIRIGGVGDGSYGADVDRLMVPVQ